MVTRIGGLRFLAVFLIGIVYITILFSTGAVEAQSSVALEDEIRASFEREGFDTSDDELIRTLAIAASESGVTSADFEPLPPVLFGGSGVAFAATDEIGQTGGVFDINMTPLTIGVAILIALVLFVSVQSKINALKQDDPEGLQRFG